MIKHFFSTALVMLFFFFYYSATAQQTVSWSKQNFTVQVNGNEIIVHHNGKTLVDITSLNFNFQPPTATLVVQQATDSLLLQLSYPPYAKYANEAGNLSAMVKIRVENNAVHFTGHPQWAYNTTILLKDNDEHYFGVVEELYPNNRKSPDLKGVVVDVDPIGNGNLYHENYASAWSAFYMTNKGYASFYDSYARGKYRLGIDGSTELYHQTGNLDWYVIAGDDGDAIMKNYYSIIGKPKYVPMWACGPVGWRDENKGGSDEILADVQKMTDLKIPFTAWMVDRPYSDGANEWSKMNFNQKFSNPQQWIKELNEKYGIQFLTWIGPLTFGDTSFPGLLPNYKGYFDLTDPAAVKEFQKRLSRYQYSANVRGHKMDRAEEDFPENSPWYDKTPEPERRAKYLYLYSKVTDDFLRVAYGDDQVNYARGAYHRCQPYLSAIWGGDSRSSWDGMAANLANAMRASFMGFPVWGTDVGGYLGGRIPEKLYARWLELGAWCGLYEIKIDDAGGRGEDRVPWKYSANLQNIFKKYCQQRLQMMPLIYSAVNTSYKNGVTMKPLAYAYPNDAQTYTIWDEYLLTDAFLVAPITDSTDQRAVYLPEGEWFDYYHPNQKYEGGNTITVQKPLDEIPVFVKAGSIWVEGLLEKGSSALWDKSKTKELRFYYYPSDNVTSTFDYIDAADGNKEKEIKASQQNQQLQITVPAINNAASFKVKLPARPKSVLINNKKTPVKWSDEMASFSLNTNKANEIKIAL